MVSSPRPKPAKATATKTRRGPARGRARKALLQPIAEETHREPSVSFPVVGIGASAGGLEALEQFLRHVPAGSGMAFVIVQHLDPTRKGQMPELLQRTTAMKVIQVRDRTRVRPNCVYVIPPGRDMGILRGVLHLFAQPSARGLRLPIDSFFRSLAHDLQQHAIGVILSGMGSDGTLGLRAIKETAGVGLVQEPRSAKFDSMPRSAIDAGLADIVAPADQLPGKILVYLQRTPLVVRPDAAIGEKQRSALEKAVILLRARTGHDFSLYRNNTLCRRIERRMGIHQIGNMSAYVRYLQENSQEVDLLFKELLIGVTNFYRDPVAWKGLGEQYIPALLAARPSGALRAWVAGCSTGEEAYSLAMAFKEAVGARKPPVQHTLQIFATDLDRDAIDKARAGIYPANIAADVSAERLSRFFKEEESGYRVRTEIREMVIFAPHNLIMDPPFTKLDILCCRNLLIYLGPELQKKLFPLFHYSLQPGGILFLGSAETVGGFTDLFEPLDAKTRIFGRSNSAIRTEPVEFPSSFTRGAAAPVRETPRSALSLQSMAEQLVIHRFSPPTVLVNAQGNILYISGKTGKYLEPAAGKANWNVFPMARKGLRYELSTAFAKALRQAGPVNLRGMKVGDGRRSVDIAIQRLDEPEPLRGLVMIAFTDVAAPPAVKGTARSRGAPAGARRLAELEAELQQARTDVMTTREAMQTSQEELKSTNEEMQSTNEELQSANEELTTSKEEMQSMNEELQTVNHELEGKVDELSHTNNDMTNLLNSTDIATLFLDKALKVRRFTSQAAKIIQLIPGDVGRPITDLASDLLYPELIDDARTTLRTLGPAERPIAGRDGSWFTVRIMPYRTRDDRIDGVVITFANITVAKKLEAKLREQQAVLRRHVARQSGQMRRTKAKSDAADRKRASRRSGE